MSTLKNIWRDPWAFIADDRVQIISGCLFVFSSAPRDISQGDYALGYFFLLGGGYLIVRAWRRLEGEA